MKTAQKRQSANPQAKKARATAVPIMIFSKIFIDLSIA